MACRREELEVEPETGKRYQLDGKSDQIGRYNRHRDDQTGKIDLAEQGRVGHKNSGCAAYALGEVRPSEHTTQIEQHSGQVVRRDLGNLPENNREHDRHQERLNDKPGWPKDRLLVLGHEIPANQQKPQIAVMQQLTPRQTEP